MATRDVPESELRAAQRQGLRSINLSDPDPESEGMIWWLYRRPLPDGRVLYLSPLLTGNQLGVSRDAHVCTFTDTWDYPSVLNGRCFTDASWRAALGWDGEGEPEGWYRHPQSGRRRPDGTHESEVICE